MPEIDVSEVLLDGLVAGEGFWVFRRAQSVSTHGRTEVKGKGAWLPAVGSVQPTGDNSMVREEAFQTQSKTLEVITSFRLRGVSQEGEQQYQPDLVFWLGDYYMVKVINDYSQYGAGMIEAECSSIDRNDRPPSPPPSPTPGQADFSRAANSGLVTGD